MRKLRIVDLCSKKTTKNHQGLVDSIQHVSEAKDLLYDALKNDIFVYQLARYEV